MPVLPLDVVDHASLQPGEVVYYTSDCSVCNGAELSRMVADDAGVLRVDDLLRPNQPGLPAGYPLAPIVTDGAGMFAAAWCHTDEGYCGKRHDGSVDDVPRSLVVSRDGGVTWTVAAEIPMGGRVIGLAGDEMLVGIEAEDGGQSALLLPSGREVSVPDEADAGFVSHPERLSLLRHDFEDGYGNETAVAIGPGGPDTWHVLEGGTLKVVAVVDDHRLLANASREAKTGLDPVNGAVLVDLDAGTIASFPGLDSSPESAASAIALVAGPFFRVDAGGDCLNVRTTVGVGAPVLMCAADGVLLGDREDAWERDGMTWLAVRTPDGRSGWASSEYLR